MPPGPPLPIRLAGRAITEAVARVPGAWRVLRSPTQRYFTRLAPTWDQGMAPEQRLAPLLDAIERLPAPPRRILDVGTGTGVGALWLAERFPDAEVLGVDISPEMIEQARAKASAARFEVGEPRAAAPHGPFDLVVHLNCPVLFDDVAAVTAEGGTVLVAASSGARTPFYTSHGALRRGFRRAGLTVTAEGRAGAGTWLAARR
jgi:methylase of polypeptide subunit release factors